MSKFTMVMIGLMTFGVVAYVALAVRLDKMEDACTKAGGMLIKTANAGFQCLDVKKIK